MAYDAKRRKVVLFGGFRDCFRCDINEIWEYGLPPLQVEGIEANTDGSIAIRWSGEAPPYQLQSCSSLSAANWQNEDQTTEETRATVKPNNGARFFRVLSLFATP